MGLFDNLFKKKGNPKKINIFDKGYEVNLNTLGFSQLGMEKYLIKDYAGVILECSKAINLQPKNQNLHTMRGMAYKGMGIESEAEKNFRNALKILPNDFISSYFLGMIFFSKKDFENAIKWLKVSYDNLPEGDFDHLGIDKKIIAGNLGNFLTQVNKHEEGFKYLDEAIRLDPNYPNPYMAKGLALAQIGRGNEGIIYLEKAEKLGVEQATIFIQMVKNSNKPKQIRKLDYPTRNEARSILSSLANYNSEESKSKRQFCAYAIQCYQKKHKIDFVTFVFTNALVDIFPEMTVKDENYVDILVTGPDSFSKYTSEGIDNYFIENFGSKLEEIVQQITNEEMQYAVEITDLDNSKDDSLWLVETVKFIFPLLRAYQSLKGKKGMQFQIEDIRQVPIDYCVAMCYNYFIQNGYLNKRICSSIIKSFTDEANRAVNISKQISYDSIASDVYKDLSNPKSIKAAFEFIRQF